MRRLVCVTTALRRAAWRCSHVGPSAEKGVMLEGYGRTEGRWAADKSNAYPRSVGYSQKAGWCVDRLSFLSPITKFTVSAAVVVPLRRG